MSNSSFTCDFLGCGKYLHLPVTLPCGITICLEHINQTTKFDCYNCKIQHTAIDDFGFRINNKLEDLINNNSHLNGKHKEVKELCDKLHSKLNDINKSNLNDPESFVFDYFASLRNQIDLHRDQMIEEINKNSEKLLKQLKEFENETKKNGNKIKRIQINDYAAKNASNILREPDLNLEMLLRLQNDLNNSMSKLDKKRKLNENLLKMNREIEFIKLDNKSFGFFEVRSLRKFSFNPYRSIQADSVIS